MNENRCEPPWFLIAKQAVRGTSLETLSVRFHVSVEDIRRHLDKAIVASANGEVAVRTNAEINQASHRARNDLVSVLLEAIDELSASQQPRLSQLAEFGKLLEGAARLFQWPMLTRHSYAVQQYMNAGRTVPTEAVNLDLIATTPEELARLAEAQRTTAREVPTGQQSQQPVRDSFPSQ
jgi:hypothetical protein